MLSTAACIPKTSPSINRNILECKSGRVETERIADNVLIETYWNVNLPNGRVKAQTTVVLIETYWNVNLAVVPSKKSASTY